MIRCRYYRWRLACLVDEQAVPQGPLLGHIKTCPTCKAFYKGQHAIAEELLEGAAPVSAMSLPGGGNHLDLRAIEAPEKARFLRLGGLRVGAIAAGLLVLAYWGASRYLQQDSRQASAQVLRGAVTASSELATDWMTTSTSWMESPYTREMELLTSDAGRAVRFLAKCTINPLHLAADTEGAAGELQSN